MTPFGRYNLLQRLAVGGMAEIFLARSSSIDGFEKILVIKRIRADLSSDERFFSMFIDEARLSIGFTHPNVVQMFDFGKIDDSYYLAMELVNGCDLGTVLGLPGVAERGLDAGIALLILGEVCLGLDYAHNLVGNDGRPLNVVHRDVSPANILLGYNGAVKIGDFGIAEARGRLTGTLPGMVVGKLSYMSPEQANGQPIDRRSDIFSAGIVLWEALAGRPAYGDGVDEDYFDRISKARLSPPSSVKPDIPAKLDALVMRALAPRPEDCYSSARELGEAIRRYRVAVYPEASAYDLQAFLHSHAETLRARISSAAEEGVPPSTGVAAIQPPAPIVPKPPPPAAPALRPAGFDWSPELIQAIESFRRRPSLWTIVKMGKICEREGRLDAADTFWRAAAVKFAQAGLLAQALLCSKIRLYRSPFERLHREIAQLPLLPGAGDDEIGDVLALGEGPLETLLRELLTEGVSADHKPAAGGTPLLSYLGGEAFAAFANEARLLSFEEGQRITVDGQLGQTMYLIGEGRVLVHATGSEGERIYLSSLTSGDFFGENSFFSGAPRSATVEALYPVSAFEIDRDIYDRVMNRNPHASHILLRFYKERIVDNLLARSPIFGKLPAEDRRALLPQFNLRMFDRGATVIQEGDVNDQIYLIKSGTAEVFTEKGGPRTQLSTIGPGTVFGEVAALRQVPRTASVTAATALETLELSGSAFHRVLDSKPDVRKRILDVVAQRARENIDKVMGPSPFARNLPPR